MITACVLVGIVAYVYGRFDGRRKTESWMCSTDAGTQFCREIIKLDDEFRQEQIARETV